MAPDLSLLDHLVDRGDELRRAQAALLHGGKLEVDFFAAAFLEETGLKATEAIMLVSYDREGRLAVTFEKKSVE